jgi:hypothetical protein
MGIQRRFTEHPASVDETYIEHFKVASGIARELIVAGSACLLHAFVPSMCETTGSSKVRELNARIAGRGDCPEEVELVAVASASG